MEVMRWKVMRWKRRDRMNYSEKTQQEIIEEIQALRRQLSEQQRAFEESEARYRNLFEASFEGIIIHEEGRILDVNPALLKMFGYTSSELIGQFVTIII